MIPRKTEDLKRIRNSRNDECNDLAISCEKFQKKEMKKPIDNPIATPTIDFENNPTIIELTNIIALIEPVKNRMLAWFLA